MSSVREIGSFLSWDAILGIQSLSKNGEVLKEKEIVKKAKIDRRATVPALSFK